MSRDNVKTQIENIIKDRTNSVEEQISALKTMRDDFRAEIRAATESSMVDDNDLGEELKMVDEALEELEARPDSIEDTGAATL